MILGGIFSRQYFSIVAKTSGPKRGFDSTLTKLAADNRLERGFLD